MFKSAEAALAASADVREKDSLFFDICLIGSTALFCLKPAAHLELL
jgi:hypothetical protein